MMAFAQFSLPLSMAQYLGISIVAPLPPHLVACPGLLGTLNPKEQLQSSFFLDSQGTSEIGLS